VKTKGKAAIDVICNPLGKSGGALIQQFMILGFGSLAASTPYLGAILLTIVLMWINAANSLSGQFAEEQRRMEADIRGEGSMSTSSTDGSVSTCCLVGGEGACVGWGWLAAFGHKVDAGCSTSPACIRHTACSLAAM
jgi:hypothetical protein